MGILSMFSGGSLGLYVLLAALIAGSGGFLYIKYLRTRLKARETELALAKAANEQNVKVITEMHAQNAEWRRKYEEAVKADTAATAEKQTATTAAEKIKGGETDTITQADLDALKAAKKNRGK